MKNMVVIGLGRFGMAVATELCALGHQVLAVDSNPELVQMVADEVTHAVTADARNAEVLEALGIRDYDCAIVAMGSDVGSSALITLQLKELGVPRVICKAQSHVHLRLLEKLGADRVIFPEFESAVNLAQGLANSSVLNFIELSPDYGLVEVDMPAGWAGKTIRELDVRVRYQVNIISVRRGEDICVAPGGDWVLAVGDRLFVVGRDEHIAGLCRR